MFVLPASFFLLRLPSFRSRFRTLMRLPRPTPCRPGTTAHAEREYAYDRQSKIGKLDKVLDEETAKNWTVVDMKQDWKRIFPFEK